MSMVNMFIRDTIESKYIETVVSRSLPEKRLSGLLTLYYAGHFCNKLLAAPTVALTTTGLL
jgi:hypothetical protein